MMNTYKMDLENTLDIYKFVMANNFNLNWPFLFTYIFFFYFLVVVHIQHLCIVHMYVSPYLQVAFNRCALQKNQIMQSQISSSYTRTCASILIHTYAYGCTAAVQCFLQLRVALAEKKEYIHPIEHLNLVPL